MKRVRSRRGQAYMEKGLVSAEFVSHFPTQDPQSQVDQSILC